MEANRNNIAIVLQEPHFPENIGAVARAAKNMGIKRLIVVKPLDCDLTRILKTATHEAEDIVMDMQIHNDLREALTPFNYIVGATARTGSHRQTINNPRRLAEELVLVSQDNKIGLLFGPENRGLANSELRYCDALVTIPTVAFASLNLAQAVMVIAYEIHMASIDQPKNFTPRLAERGELEGMYDQLQKTLAKIHFINPENPEYWMMGVRRFFSRVGLRAREVKLIRGICRQIDWYCDQRPQLSSASGSQEK
jgi:tRNA/rRNA methyltransferase